jgi:hypothetical protein
LMFHLVTLIRPEDQKDSSNSNLHIPKSYKFAK